MTNAVTTTQSTYEAQITELSEQLKPCGPTSVAKALLSLANAGLSLPRGIKADKQDTVYAYALDGIPQQGLARAVQKLIRGEYERKDYGGIPKPPEMAKLAREESAHLLSALRTAKEAVRQIEEIRTFKAGRQRSETEQERITARVAAARAMNMKVETLESMDGEKVDYFKRISGLRDRGDITEEQKAMQRRVAIEIKQQTGDENGLREH